MGKWLLPGSAVLNIISVGFINYFIARPGLGFILFCLPGIALRRHLFRCQDSTFRDPPPVGIPAADITRIINARIY